MSLAVGPQGHCHPLLGQKRIRTGAANKSIGGIGSGNGVVARSHQEESCGG